MSDYPYGNVNQPYSNVPASGASQEDRAPAVIAHLSSLIALVISVGWLSFIGPLLVWLIYKDRSPFVRQAAAGSFNFNLGMWIMNIVAWICFFTIVGIPIAIVLWIISGLGQIIFHLLATLRASKGKTFNYPFQLRVLS